MSQAITSLLTSCAVLMHTLLCCSAHCVSCPEACETACECCQHPPLEFAPATPWLEGEFAGFTCRDHGSISHAGCCEHAPGTPSPCHEHHKCACVLAAPHASQSSRDIKTKQTALAPLVGPVAGCLTTAAEPFLRLATGESPLRYGALRPHLALAVLLR